MAESDINIQDAQEMFGILRSAKCLARYSKISHELLSELLVAVVTNGNLIGRNNRGSDIEAPEYGLIEVKSRILGTDGPNPRISLRKHHLEKADWVAALRWDSNFLLQDAIMLPIKSVGILHEAKRQADGLAHIGWKDWISNPDSKSIFDLCQKVLSSN